MVVAVLLWMATPSAEAGWAQLVRSLPEAVLVIGGSMLVHLVVFWALAAFFHVVDRTDRPAWIARHRIQRGRRRRPPYPRVMRNLAANQLLWSPLLLGLLYLLLRARGWEVQARLPGTGQVLLELVGLGLCSVVVFYVTHRFLHRKWWLKRVHRVHHEFRTTTALASEYAHPVEFCIGNFGTLAAGVLLLAPSLPSILLYTALAITTVVIHHSGYALPFAPWSVHHDWHHYRYHEAFGTLGLLDRLLGTAPELDELEDGEVV